LRTLVSLLCYPKFYAIIISELPIVDCDIQKECTALRKEIESALKNVSSNMNYANFMDYQSAFQCPMHSGEVHLCVMASNSMSTKIMDCLQNPKSIKSVKMEKHHMVWFDKVSLYQVSFCQLIAIILFIILASTS